MMGKENSGTAHSFSESRKSVAALRLFAQRVPSTKQNTFQAGRLLFYYRALKDCWQFYLV